ncbi:histidine kinase [Marispirochaeta sp.]|uniref:sensor histidine kinase n=1 Tax=Marispirochaeta sp. TaxID=2038653 RepID=UPI0029C8F0A9|nr:histidine kinase [Marispirochaeta sp.]
MRARKSVLVIFALVGPIVTALAVTMISYIVYHQVSAEMVVKTQELLHGHLESVNQTIINVFSKAANNANILLSDIAISEENRDRFRWRLAQLTEGIPSCRKGWILFPDGTVLSGSMTSLTLLERNPWWRGYAAPDYEKAITLFNAQETVSIIGEPFRDDLNLNTIVPIIVYRFNGVRLVATIFIETDVTELLVLYLRTFTATLGNKDSDIEISIYDKKGDLIETTRNLPVMKVQPFSKESRLSLSAEDLRTLQINTRLSFVVADYVELFRWDTDSGFIYSSRIPHSAIVSGVTSVTLRILGIGLFSVVVIVILGLLLVRALYRMKTFEAQQIQARLETLQAKIEPHFLFNTLDSIIGVVEKDDRKTLLTMLRSLSYMLHMSLRKEEDLITLAEEIQYVTSYVDLQRIRFIDSFQFELNVKKELLNLYVHRFCIQPIVENCFVHGVAKLPLNPIRIVVTIEKSNGSVIVTVSDDGGGCESEILDCLESRFSKDKNLATDQIGLLAVHSRLRSAHGKKYGLRLLQQSRGFGIQAVLPILTKPI